MKQSIALLLLLNISSLSHAQKDWTELSDMYERAYSLAKTVEDVSSRVNAQMDTISIDLRGGAISLRRKDQVTNDIYSLSTTTGKDIELDKMNSERVIDAFEIKLLELQYSEDEVEETRPGTTIGSSQFRFTKRDNTPIEEPQDLHVIANNDNQDADVESILDALFVDEIRNENGYRYIEYGQEWPETTKNGKESYRVHSANSTSEKGQQILDFNSYSTGSDDNISAENFNQD